MVASHRGEGNSGGIGAGMQFQNPPNRDPISGARSQAVYDEAAGGTAVPSTTDNGFIASSGAQGNGAGDEGPNIN